MAQYLFSRKFIFIKVANIWERSQSILVLAFCMNSISNKWRTIRLGCLTRNAHSDSFSASAVVSSYMRCRVLQMSWERADHQDWVFSLSRSKRSVFRPLRSLHVRTLVAWAGINRDLHLISSAFPFQFSLSLLRWPESDIRCAAMLSILRSLTNFC